MSTAIAPEYGSAAWKAEHRRHIGASDVPAILGVSPFAGAYDVALAKLGLADDKDTPALRWGHYHEVSIAAEYQRQFPDVALEAPGTIAHARYPWLRATVDRLVHAPHGVFPLEIKSTSEYMGDRWGDVGTDEVPDHVLVQVQVQLMVLGLSYAHVAVLIGHSDCRLPYVVEADGELQEMIVERCAAFHDLVFVRGELPEIDGPNRESHLKRKYQTHTDVVRDLDGADAALLDEYLAVYQQRKAHEAREAELRPQIMALIGDDYGVRSAAGKAIWYGTKGRASLDSKGLIAALKVPEDIIQQYTRVGQPSRTFRPMPVKEAA